jgi:hypothetical protein
VTAAKTMAPGSRLRLYVSDPWEFGAQLGCGPFYARVVQYGPDPDGGRDTPFALVQLEAPVVFEDTHCEYFVVRARHQGCHIWQVLEGEDVSCNLTRVPAERLQSDAPLSLSWWRGGVALIGNITIAGVLPRIFSTVRGWIKRLRRD